MYRNHFIALALLTLLTALAPVGAAYGEVVREIAEEIPAAKYERLIIDARSGEVYISAGDKDTIQVKVGLEPRRAGFLFSREKGNKEVERAKLATSREEKELHVRIRSSFEDRHFAEIWRVVVPRRMAVKLSMGAGDIEVSDIEGGLDANLGAGDIDVDVPGGDISVDLGAGDVEIRASASGYKKVEVDVGMGDAKIKAKGEEIDGKGFVAKDIAWKGEGEASIDVAVGAGDGTVVLR